MLIHTKLTKMCPNCEKKKKKKKKKKAAQENNNISKIDRKEKKGNIKETNY